MLHPRHFVAARALADWSQADLASAAGVALRTVQGLEEGSRDTRFSSVVAIIEALRRRGVEFAQASDRYAGGVVIIRGSDAEAISLNTLVMLPANGIQDADLVDEPTANAAPPVGGVSRGLRKRKKSDQAAT